MAAKRKAFVPAVTQPVQSIQWSSDFTNIPKDGTKVDFWSNLHGHRAGFAWQCGGWRRTTSIGFETFTITPDLWCLSIVNPTAAS